MEQKNQRNSRKRLNSLILLVAFTAILLIVSTYAWFSTQRNVTLTGLHGQVNVAEGLQISLDAERWVNAIDFDDFDQTSATGWTMAADASTQYFAEGQTFQNPVSGNVITNVTPSEYLPVSTTGGSTVTDAVNKNDGIGTTAVKFYNGEVQNFDHLEGIESVTENNDAGYYAFDLFLMNTSASTVEVDKIQLDSTSAVTGDVSSTGVQNTARVAFALYQNVNDTTDYKAYTANDYTLGNDMTIHSGNPLTPETIRTGTLSYNIKDVAIWEPNADAHTTTIVNNFAGQMTWPSAWDNGFETPATLPTGDFDADDYLPTYALTAGSTTANYEIATGTNSANGTIKDIYNWSDDEIEISKLALQYTTQTSATTARTGSIDLRSISEIENPTGLETTGGTQNDGAFDIAPNQYHRIRVYVWMEGQDPDCINAASLGGGLTLDLGFSKPSSEASGNS